MRVSRDRELVYQSGSLNPEAQRLKHKEIAQRYRPKGLWTPASWLTRRLTEIEIVLLDRYGWVLPDDDVGLGDLSIILFHMAKCARHNEHTMRAWITAHAPWLTPAWAEEQAVRLRYTPSADNLISYAIANKAKKPPSRKRLAKMLGLTDAVRTRLAKGKHGAITTIGVIDERRSTARRRQAKSDWDKDYQQTRRRAAGAKPQAASAEATQQWLAEGVPSRRTWYRRRAIQKGRGTTSSHCNVPSVHAVRRNSATERAATPSNGIMMTSSITQTNAVRPARAARPHSPMVNVYDFGFALDRYRHLGVIDPAEVLVRLETLARWTDTTSSPVQAA